MARTTGDVIVEKLIDWGVDTAFGLPGDGINGILEALRKNQDKIRFIQCRHEEAAAFAACGYAKFTGRLGVCIATSGPGAIHLLNGLYDAKLDHAPVLAITGQTYHDLMGMHYQQEVNLLALFADVAVFNQHDPRGRSMPASWSTPPAAPRCRTRSGRAPELPDRLPGLDDSRTRISSMQMVRGHTSSAWRPPIVVPQDEIAQGRRGPAQRAARRPSSSPGRGRWAPATSSSSWPTSWPRRSSSRCWARRRPRRLALHHRRHRPAGHAPLRAGDGGMRQPADGRHELPVHEVLSQARTRPRPCRSTATRPASACATRSTSA